MHNIYKSKGLFDVSYQLPIIVYSSFISMFLGSLIQMLGLTNDAITDFKRSEEINNANERGKKLFKIIKIKFILYLYQVMYYYFFLVLYIHI